MKKKIVLLLQGGGALGAFQCGAWEAISPFMRENGHDLVAVAGVSIGALNAGLIARYCHDPDGGVGALQDFWQSRLANLPMPFFPMPGEYWRAWNGLLTGLLLGNGALFSPAYQYWNPVGDMFRFHMPLYQTDNAERTMAAVFGEYRGSAPVLAAGLTDVESGEAVLLDSVSRTITSRMFAASIAIPILFSPVEIDGRYFWDGEMRSNTLLPDVFALLQKTSPRPDTPDELLVIVIDMFSSGTDRPPTSVIETQYRFLNVLLGGKLNYDLRAFEVGNTCLDAMERLRGLARRESGSPLAAAVEEEYQKVLARQHARVELLHIGRHQYRYEHISRDFDYSPQYIARLIEQGFDSASHAVRDYQEKTLAGQSAYRGEDRAQPGIGEARKAHPHLVQGKEWSEG